MRLADAISLRSRRAEARPLPRGAAADRRDDGPRRGRGRARLRRGRRVRDPELLRGALPVAGAHHRARAPRRRVPRALPGHPVRAGRRVRRSPSPTASSTSSSRTRSSSTSATGSASGGSSSRRSGSAGDVRRRCEPPVPHRGAHAAPLRPLASRPGRAPPLRPRREGLREGGDHLLSRCRTLQSLFPGRVRIVDLGLTLVAIVISGARRHRRRDRRPRHRARRPQRRDGAALRGRRARGHARRRRGVEGSAPARGPARRRLGRARAPRDQAVDVLAAELCGRDRRLRLQPQGALDGDATGRGGASRSATISSGRRVRARPAARASGRSGRGWGRRSSSRWSSRWPGSSTSPFVSLQAWRIRRPGLVRGAAGLDYEGLSGLPENWVYNTGDEDSPIRRLVSTFLSPLASAYALVVALISVASRRSVGGGGRSVSCCSPRCSIRTHAPRSPLSLGLVVLAVAQRRAAAGGARRRHRSPSARRSSSPIRRWALDELHRGRAPVAARERRGRGRDGPDPFPATTVEREPLAHLRDGSGRARAPTGLRARQRGEWWRSAPASRSRRASRRTPSSASMPGSWAVVASLLWSIAILLGLWRREAWPPPRSCPCSLWHCRRT